MEWTGYILEDKSNQLHKLTHYSGQRNLKKRNVPLCIWYINTMLRRDLETWGRTDKFPKTLYTWIIKDGKWMRLIQGKYVK